MLLTIYIGRWTDVSRSLTATVALAVYEVVDAEHTSAVRDVNGGGRVDLGRIPNKAAVNYDRSPRRAKPL